MSYLELRARLDITAILFFLCITPAVKVNFGFLLNLEAVNHCTFYIFIHIPEIIEQDWVKYRLRQTWGGIGSALCVAMATLLNLFKLQFSHL